MIEKRSRTAGSRRRACLGGWPVVFVAVLFVASPPPCQGDETEMRDRAWDVELEGGISFYKPTVEGIPRGSTTSTHDLVLGASLGRTLSDRLGVRLALGYSKGSGTTWRSEVGRVTADIGTPSTGSISLGLEARLRSEGLLPTVGIGAGLVRFGEVDETIMFVSSSGTERSEILIETHTDPSVHFDLGVVVAMSDRFGFVTRYRFRATFSVDQVNTLDRVAAAIRMSL